MSPGLAPRSTGNARASRVTPAGAHHRSGNDVQWQCLPSIS